MNRLPGYRCRTRFLHRNRLSDPGIEDLLTAFETVSPEDFPSLADEVVPDLHEPAGQAPVAIPAATPLADWTEPELPVLEEVPVLDMAAEPGSGPMPGTFEPVDPESFPSDG